MKFLFGQTVTTCGVRSCMDNDPEFAQFVQQSLKRHGDGDWGDMCRGDKRENELALRRGKLRIFSAYEHPQQPKIWIITEADRSVTTVLFPDEY